MVNGDKVIIGATTLTFSDPSRPEAFWVYGCPGNPWLVKKQILKKLGLPEMSREEGWMRTEDAVGLLEDTKPADGTLVEKYLRGRAITVPLRPRRQVRPRLWHHESRASIRAMVAVVTDHRGAFTWHSPDPAELGRR